MKGGVKMKKNRRIVIIVLCAVIALAGAAAGALVWGSRVERQFPMWKTPCIDPDKANSGIDSEVTLRFTGIEPNVSIANGDICDKVLLTGKSSPGHSIGGGELAWVDYFYEGEWHTVWCNDHTMAVAVIYGTPKTADEEIPIDEYVPAGLFARDGQYRLYKDGLGYCDIDINGIDLMK